MAGFRDVEKTVRILRLLEHPWADGVAKELDSAPAVPGAALRRRRRSSTSAATPLRRARRRDRRRRPAPPRSAGTRPSVRPAGRYLDRASVEREAPGSSRRRRRWPRKYPADPGVLVTLLLNHVVLSPGEAMFLDAGVVHAYTLGLRRRDHGVVRQRRPRGPDAQARRRARAAAHRELHPDARRRCGSRPTLSANALAYRAAGGRVRAERSRARPGPDCRTRDRGSCWPRGASSTSRAQTARCDAHAAGRRSSSSTPTARSRLDGERHGRRRERPGRLSERSGRRPFRGRSTHGSPSWRSGLDVGVDHDLAPAARRGPWPSSRARARPCVASPISAAGSVGRR